MAQMGMVIHNIIVKSVVLTAYLNPESAIWRTKFVFSTVIKVWIWAALNRGTRRRARILRDRKLFVYKEATVFSDY